MQQLDLFDIPQSINPLLISNLHEAAIDGNIFYNVGSVAKLFHMSTFRIHYLIRYYRLDAILIGGQYKVPYTALIDYLTTNQQIKEQHQSYLKYVDFMIETREYNDELECKFNKVKYDDLPGDEESTVDWYNLNDLNLPFEATLTQWAQILLTNPKYLTSIDKPLINGCATVVSWLEMYDWLIEREVVNLPIPYQLKEETINIEEDLQYSLF